MTVRAPQNPPPELAGRKPRLSPPTPPVGKQAEKITALSAALEKALAFIEGIHCHYGEGLEVKGWHLNGDLEPLDTFIDEAGDGDEIEVIRAALALTK